ncbi:MAG: hypothetical protein KF761_00425 [Salinibacterium sp.]|nr:hypothetical protein [Salinibacterium sp.]
MTPRLRYILLGIGGLALAVVVGLLIALALRAITAGTPTSAGPLGVAPTAATPAVIDPETSTPAPSRPDPGKNECVDALGDGAADLDAVRLSLDGGDLVVRFALVGGVPMGSSTLELYAQRSADKAYRFVIDLRDGDVDRVFVANLDKSSVDTLDAKDVSVEGDVVTAVFPRSSVKRLGNDWSWYATATVPGSPRDVCPGTATDPILLQFER